MGPGTLAKFYVGECAFKKITNPGLIGIFSYENEMFPPSLSDSSLGVEIKVRRGITVGCFPVAQRIATHTQKF